MFNSVKQVSAIEKFNKCSNKQGSLPDKSKKRTVKEIIVKLLTTQIFKTAQKIKTGKLHKSNAKTNVSDRMADVRQIRTNRHTFVAENYFLEKYKYQNSRSPRGRVINCHSRRILNPGCGNGSKG
eukprot:6473543-Ditylum_brightwellii.AAC.1